MKKIVIITWQQGAVVGYQFVDALAHKLSSMGTEFTLVPCSSIEGAVNRVWSVLRDGLLAVVYDTLLSSDMARSEFYDRLDQLYHVHKEQVLLIMLENDPNLRTDNPTYLSNTEMRIWQHYYPDEFMMVTQVPADA